MLKFLAHFNKLLKVQVHIYQQGYIYRNNPKPEPIEVDPSSKIIQPRTALPE